VVAFAGLVPSDPASAMILCAAQVRLSFDGLADLAPHICSILRDALIDVRFRSMLIDKFQRTDSQRTPGGDHDVSCG
jgi:hypothetical protein